MSIETIRPALTLTETETIIEALDELSVASHSLDKIDKCMDIKLRLAEAARRKGWRLDNA
jgi:hypothetical protein